MKIPFSNPVTNFQNETIHDADGSVFTLGTVVVSVLLSQRGQDYDEQERYFDLARRISNAQAEKNESPLELKLEQVADIQKLLKQSGLPAQIKVPVVRMLEDAGKSDRAKGNGVSRKQGDKKNTEQPQEEMAK